MPDAADKLASPPGAYKEFVQRFPDLGEAWNSIRDTESAGPLNKRQRRLLKLAVAMGAMRPGAVSSGVRKALAAEASIEEIEQLLALTASTVGMPAAVALFGWVRGAADKA